MVNGSIPPRKTEADMIDTIDDDEQEEAGLGYVVCPNCKHKWYLYQGDLK